MKIFLILLIAVAVLAQEDLGAELYEARDCKQKDTLLKLYAIDAIIKMPNMTACTYQFNITTGRCYLNTSPVLQSTTGYVCINQSGEFCPRATGVMAGIATINCDGNIMLDTLSKVTGAKPGQEVTLRGKYVDLRAAIGYVCNDTNDPSLSIQWIPRQCLVFTPSPPLMAESYSYMIHIGTAAVLVLLMIFL